MKMCQLKSGIVLKDRIFMPEYDSHSKMLEELGIKDDYLGASKKFVRVELSPENGDVFSNIDEWKLKVDQDIKPEWFSEEEYKPKIVEAVKEWAKKHIHIGVDNLKITEGGNHYIKNCKGVQITNSTVTAWENSTVTNNPCWTWYKQNALILSDNATFKDKIGKVIYQSGDYKLISVESGKKIGDQEG